MCCICTYSDGAWIQIATGSLRRLKVPGGNKPGLFYSYLNHNLQVLKWKQHLWMPGHVYFFTRLGRLGQLGRLRRRGPAAPQQTLRRGSGGRTQPLPGQRHSVQKMSSSRGARWADWGYFATPNTVCVENSVDLFSMHLKSLSLLKLNLLCI